MDTSKLEKLRGIASDDRIPQEHRARAAELLKSAEEPRQVAQAQPQQGWLRKVMDALTKYREANKTKAASNEQVITKQEQQMSPKQGGDQYLKSLWLR